MRDNARLAVLLGWFACNVLAALFCLTFARSNPAASAGYFAAVVALWNAVAVGVECWDEFRAGCPREDEAA
jgi:hypothetical protein